MEDLDCILFEFRFGNRFITVITRKKCTQRALKVDSLMCQLRFVLVSLFIMSHRVFLKPRIRVRSINHYLSAV